METTNDKTNAQALLEDIEFACSRHPTGRQDATFTSRAITLTKRLAMRGDPLSPTSFFPRPSHPLFQDQADYNESTLKLLSSEYRAAQEIVSDVEKLAKEYHANFEAVRRVEVVCKTSSQLQAQLASLITSLEEGSEAESGDGSPPDLSSEQCLESSRHQVFLALFPTLIKEVEKADLESSNLLQDATQALLDLSNHSGVEPQFIADSKGQIAQLVETRKQLSQIRTTVADRVGTLNEIRRIWSNMEGVFVDLEGNRQDLCENIQQSVWQSQTRQDSVLLTPESSVSSLAVPLDPLTAPPSLESISARVDAEVSQPLLHVSDALDGPLKDYLRDSCNLLTSLHHNVQSLSLFLDSIRNQASVMSNLHEEVQDLQLRMEDLKAGLDANIEETLSGQLAGDDLDTTRVAVDTDFSQLEQTVRSLLDGLPQRVPFVAKGSPKVRYDSHARRSSLPGAFNLETLRQRAAIGLPVDPDTIDRAVRTDCNAYSMHLSAAVEALTQKSLHFHLVKDARAIDTAMQSSTESMQRIDSTLSSLQGTFNPGASTFDDFTNLSTKLNQLLEHNVKEHVHSLDAVRTQLRRLNEESAPLSSDVRSSLTSSRQRALDQAMTHCQDKKEAIRRFLQQVSDSEAARRDEEARLKMEQERLAREAAEQAERDRLAAEQRAEEERLLREAEAKAEQERLEAEARAQQERLEAEAKAERERIEAEAEAERKRIEAEAEAERQRIEAAAEAERQRLEAEAEVERQRVEAEAKAERERLEAEAQAERDRLKAEEEAKAERERLQAEAQAAKALPPVDEGKSVYMY